MIGKFHLPISAGGVSDPFPASDGWFLITSLVTATASGNTFDPTIVASSGNFGWDLGDGSYIKSTPAAKSLAYAYQVGGNKTVKLYGKGTCNITELTFDGDDIVGVFDLSHNAFKSLTFVSVNSNGLMTGLLLPTTMTSTFQSLYIQDTGITGTLDLSMLSSWTASGRIVITGCISTTSIAWASTITGSFSQIRIQSVGLTGNLDLSKFTNWSSAGDFQITSNLSLTSIITPSSFSGTMATCVIANNTSVTGTIDISAVNAYTSSGSLQVSSMPLVTNVILPTSVTGTFSGLVFNNIGHIGALSLTQFTAFSATSTQIQAYSMPKCTSVTFASTITGTVNILDVLALPLVTSIDISMFRTFTNSARILVYSNASMTTLTTPSSAVTGSINQLYLKENNITGVLDISKYTSFSTTADVQIQNNPLVTNLVLPTTVTGTFSKLYMFGLGISGTLDVSKYTTFIAAGADIQLQLNPNLSGITFSPTTITGFIKSLNIGQNNSLGYVDLTKLKTGIASLNWSLSTNGWSAAIVNHVLVDINGISASGFTGRAINIGGTNTDPDTTSGGYNGTAARTSLIAKGFTITIT